MPAASFSWFSILAASSLPFSSKPHMVETFYAVSTEKGGYEKGERQQCNAMRIERVHARKDSESRRSRHIETLQGGYAAYIPSFDVGSCWVAWLDSLSAHRSFSFSRAGQSSSRMTRFSLSARAGLDLRVVWFEICIRTGLSVFSSHRMFNVCLVLSFWY